jgi:N6-adenosine-specific RNA methylase IME4
MKPFPNKRYKIILADPPWPEEFHKKSTKYWHGVSCSGDYYPLMSGDCIKHLPIQNIVDPVGCVLFLWSTYRHIPLALDVINSWGFTYKTIGFIWIKITKHRPFKFVMNPGFYTKGNTEPCLIATCGRVPIPTAGDVSQVIMTQRGEHSEKPIRVMTDINRLYPSLSKMELFARRKMKGWDSWGNEV